MDILSIFRTSPEKQIRKARKRVKEPHGDAAVRINAARRLWEIGTPESILALLDRFTITSSPLVHDEEEKEDVLAWIVELGPMGVPPLKTFLKHERQVYWPVRALREILSEEELTASINEILRYHWEYPPASSEPKAQLIRLLDELHSPELLQTMRLFLEDEDDDVCLGTLDYLFSQSEEEVREAILQCYLDSEDRPRVRAGILERLAEAGWRVRGHRSQVEESLPEGYTLTRDGTVKTMGRSF